MKLLFVSNLFPDTAEPYRGLDNATLLQHLANRWEIRVLAIRPALFPRLWQARGAGCRVHPAICRGALPSQNRQPLESPAHGRVCCAVAFGNCAPDSPSTSCSARGFSPIAARVAELAKELDFPFVAIAQGSDVHQYLQMPVRRKIITRLLPRASAVITRSGELARLLAEAGPPSRASAPRSTTGSISICFAPAIASPRDGSWACPSMRR
ncbi:MAG: hypothetical protein WDN28_21185 [Chthoniobacter sp.]